MRRVLAPLTLAACLSPDAPAPPAEEAAPTDVAFDAVDPDPTRSLRVPLGLTLTDPLVAGQPTALEVTGLAPGETTYLAYSLYGTGNGICPPAMGGQCLNLLSPVDLLGTAQADASGVATLPTAVPAGAPAGLSVSFQAVAIRGPGGAQTTKSPAVTDVVQAVGGTAPAVRSLEDRPHLARTDFSFVLDDPDGDLVGGTLHVTDGVDQFVLAIPGDLDTWNPGGVSTAHVPQDPLRFTCGVDLAQVWTVTATDAAGLVGPAELESTFVESRGPLRERGDVFPADAHTDLQGVPPPVHACVTFEDDPTNGQGVNQDLEDEFEGLRLEVSSAGDYRAEMIWGPATADFDLYVYYMNANWGSVDTRPPAGVADTICDDITAARDNGPATCTFAAGAGTRWLVAPQFYAPLVGAWVGSPPYTVSVLISPEAP